MTTTQKLLKRNNTRQRDKELFTACNNHTHHLIMHDFFILLLTVVMWDHGIRQLSFHPAERKSERRRRREEGKRIEGFVENNGSTKQGHLRSVYSVLTSCSHYPMFIHSFHLSYSRRRTSNKYFYLVVAETRCFNHVSIIFS